MWHILIKSHGELWFKYSVVPLVSQTVKGLVLSLLKQFLVYIILSLFSVALEKKAAENIFLTEYGRIFGGSAIITLKYLIGKCFMYTILQTPR